MVLQAWFQCSKWITSHEVYRNQRQYHSFNRVNDIRTVFWVVKYNSGAWWLLGDTSTYHFHGNGANNILGQITTTRISVVICFMLMVVQPVNRCMAECYKYNVFGYYR